MREQESSERIGFPVISSFKDRNRFEFAILESRYSAASNADDSRSQARLDSSFNCCNESSTCVQADRRPRWDLPRIHGAQSGQPTVRARDLVSADRQSKQDDQD